MAKLTKRRLEQILTEELGLRDVYCELDASGGRIGGHLVSSSFRRMHHQSRHRRIYDALEAEFGPGAEDLIGMIFTYTPEDWQCYKDMRDQELEETPPRRKRKTG